MIKEKKKVEVEAPEVPKKESEGRQVQNYFFPKYGRTIKAESIEKARQVIKEGQTK